VQLQLRIAAGEALPFSQKDVQWRGWAMECRVCAEDPETNFFPSPGTIAQLREPSGPGVRLDSGVYPGWTVPLEYDPLLAKLVTWGPNRNAAIERLQRALGEYTITGVTTNVAFFREILEDPEYRAGNISTEFVADFLGRRKPRAEPAGQLDLAVALAAAAYAKTRSLTRAAGNRENVDSRWVAQGRGQLLQ
jgi:acetyl-CoA carboxylase biotin carboxylase subunit